MTAQAARVQGAADHDMDQGETELDDMPRSMEQNDVEKGDIEQGVRAEGSASAADAAKRAKKPKPTAGKKPPDENEFDAFVSYRVNSEKKLVETLYWRLVGTTITVNGVTRNMRVFWDKKCLRTGESWEAGFSRAICSSTVVVTVMSREALASVVKLEPDSRCDNVVLEYALALSLKELKDTKIFPLLVGDKVKNDDAGLGQQIASLKEQIDAGATPGEDLEKTKTILVSLEKRHAGLDERYTHYFESGCHPTPLPEVQVRQIDDKWAAYVSEAKEALSLEDADDMRPRTVKEILDGVTTNQGHFMMGPTSDAIDAAVASIHECVQRVVEERASSRLVEGMQFSTPQGQEVLEWLAERSVAQYSHVFARNKLDSLRKVSKLSPEQISRLNDEYCRGLHGASEAQIGGHIRLADAVASLQGDPRTKSIAGRLASFSDSAAENAIAEAWFNWAFFCFLCITFFAVLAFALPIMGLPLHQALASRPHSVTSYSVQLSVDGSNWTDVICPWGRREDHSEGQGQKCVFDASPEQSSVVTHWFPSTQEGRYLRLRTRTWENDNDGAGADLRLRIMSGSSEGEPSLAFGVMQDGEPGQAWLQAGVQQGRCARRGVGGAGLRGGAGAVLLGRAWRARVHAGRVPGRRRRRRRSGQGQLERGESEVRGAGVAAVHAAGAGPEGLVWLLRQRAGGTNRCGYDRELVWTNNTGGADPLDRLGRLHSDTAFENVRQVEVDLLGMRRVDGVSVQGGVAAAGAPSRGLACLYWTWGCLSSPLPWSSSASCCSCPWGSRRRGP